MSQGPSTANTDLRVDVCCLVGECHFLSSLKDMCVLLLKLNYINYKNYYIFHEYCVTSQSSCIMPSLM